VVPGARIAHTSRRGSIGNVRRLGTNGKNHRRAGSRWDRGRLSVTTIDRAWRKLQKLAELQRRKFHALRHSLDACDLGRRRSARRVRGSRADAPRDARHVLPLSAGSLTRLRREARRSPSSEPRSGPERGDTCVSSASINGSEAFTNGREAGSSSRRIVLKK
jgi:hypothetical protein